MMGMLVNLRRVWKLKQMTAKKALKAAVELGDSDAQVEAQQKLARLAIESERVKSTQAQRESLKKEMEARGG